ncbi:MAG TPA: DUF1353 domain-containing protein [Acidobacteriota bacterium]|nr:DUF1353 domain-containing protein [Acidobacteriota bacterium]HMZ78983.1 DUF1353 domain-containing protein [Acidobacteriota bacterium]HNB72175.1 DUF1353 domain-containing protein [Acidobacteriota bacterium]HNG91819.1 DUF1353 domain-containing protein [Acidobacteriota bacterium]HNJ41712.1 DUF1353 domain-containing protein [Acidobacteriota bacterium]
MPQACYRELRAYKYQLVEDYEIQINIIPPRDLIFKFVVLTSQGKLWIKKDYAWDGPSGPTIDTKNFMRGSLVHDALYQLMRLGELDYKVYRQRADELLRDICREDGMSSFRSWYVYQGVRLFGESSARPVPEPEVTIICVP